MNSGTIISIIAIYFLALYIISYQTSRDDSNNVQGIYLCEHRNNASKRKLIITLIGN